MSCGALVRRPARLVAGWSLLLVLGATVAACAGKGKPDRLVKVTRFRDDQRVGRLKLPVCLASTSESLAERNRMNTCMRAIEKQGIAVVRDDRQPCLAATMTFAVTDAGVEGECKMSSFQSPWQREAECRSRAVHQYTLKLVLTDPEDEATVIESYVVTEAGQAGFDAGSTSALCRGAFHRYPQPVRGEMIRLDKK